MPIFAVLERLRPRTADPFATYHLLGNERDDQEKGDESETRDSSVDLSTAQYTSKKCILMRRWLRMLSILLPSFLQTPPTQSESKQPRPTAWLDGLRGIAALFVVLHHMSLIWFPWALHNGWVDTTSHYIQLPILRLLISGPANVMVFFVISGYALSWKPLGLIQKDQPSKMYRALASSTFRRHPRLFIPAFIICAPAPLITYFGGYADREGMPGAAIQPMNPPRFDTLWAQFAHYTGALLGLSDFFNANSGTLMYSDSLWTLPIEFRSSIVVFTLLLALSRCTIRARVGIMVSVAVYALWYCHWGEFLFIGGMLVVEVNLSAQRRADARGSGEVLSTGRTPLRNSTLRRSFALIAFLGVLFLLSMPEQGRGAAESYGYSTLSELIPAHFHAAGAADRFWQPIAAVLLILVIDRTRFLQGIFTTRVAQYLGRVSFALYLVHMLILHSLGFYLGRYFLEFTGAETNWQYGTGIGLAGVVVGVVIIWAADLGSRFVDANAVRFTAWVYGRLCKAAVEG